ncbi:unnamed protein product [Litomosoides sigmodontis]|uniref:VWFA domain-containing protein n=1 Tax=Litomosoides sigmodontis TaxID=42156 RepID=A0A3P6T9A0_LITSI|nr:unnamed protein product [Litomosoides sigmodontis]
MVFSKELGYDPDEWEECSDSDRFILLSFTGRMFLSLTSVILTILFFWFLEVRRQLDKSREASDLFSKDVLKGKMDELEMVKERLGKLRQTETNFSKEETEALEEWQREVARIEELRLQDLVEHVVDASGMISEVETESQLIDHLLPADHISLETDSAETEQTHSLVPSNIPTAVYSIAYTEDVIASIQDEANAVIIGNERENGSVSSTNDWEAPAQSEFFVEQVQECIYNLNDTEVSDHNIRASFGNGDDFVKVYTDELQKNDSEMLQERSQQRIDAMTSALPDITTQKAIKEGQQPVTIGLSSGQLYSVPVITADYDAQENQQQTILWKPDKKTFEQTPTTTTERVEPDQTREAIAQIAETALASRMTGNFVMNVVEREPVAAITVTGREPLTDEECRRLMEAEMYIQDAIEYVTSEIHPEAPSGFIVEEEMLNNTSESANVTGDPILQQLPASPEATSRMFKTNEIFEKAEEPMEIDDAMTYAPEIQSIEIQPDEASVNSENLLEYFDQVAAEYTDLPLLQPTKAAKNASFTESTDSSQSIPLLKNSKSFMSSGSQPAMKKRSSLLSVLGVTSTQEMLLALTSLEDLSNAMRKAGLQSTNLIFGIDYTASNKYQGELCFQGRSLHSLDAFKENPYQQVIKIMGRIFAPFATSGFIPAYGFGDVKTSDWSVFKLKPEGECRNLDELLQVYDAITPTISLSGPTNFAPLIYEAIAICEKVQNYHILVIVADGQVTNEKATRKAIVQACQYPLSIIVVGVGDGPWDMMKVFDESLPRRPWDNFHFVEFHRVLQKADNVDAGELSFAVQSLLEIPDQYNTVRQLGLIRSVSPIPEHDP